MQYTCLPFTPLVIFITYPLDLGYIFQQGGASPWLNPSERWSGSAKILPGSQLFLSVQHNFCPLEFRLLQSLTKTGHIPQLHSIPDCFKFILQLETSI